MDNYLIKQLSFAVIGIVACFVLWKFIPYHWWRGPLVWIPWLLALVLLGMTALVGNEGYGAVRWVDIGGFGLQPSEFAKIAFLLMATRILVDFREGALTLKGTLIQAFVLILIPLLFMYRSQSDLGTTLICFVGIFMVMWLGEVPLKVIGGIIVAGVLFALIAIFASSGSDYRADRFLFMNPWADGQEGLGDGYQLIHSYFAFAQGGILGEGLGNSREKFLYLPMSETDFIYAIIGEELGFIGAVAIIGLFLVFLYAGMRISRSAPDDFASLLAGGFTIMLVAQAFLNIGCVIGVLPTTGKPLPFISSGGSSLIASLMMLGIILSVSNASGAPSVYEQRRADLRVVKAQPPSSSRGSSRGTGVPGSGRGARNRSNEGRSRTRNQTGSRTAKRATQKTSTNRTSTRAIKGR